MMASTDCNLYTLSLDIKKKQQNYVPKFVQYDKSALRFSLADDGVPINLIGMTKAELTQKHQESGKAHIGACSIETEGGKQYVRYDYRGSEMAQVGFLSCSLSMFFGEDKISTLPFNVEIVTDLQQDYLEEAFQEVGILQELIQQAENQLERIELVIGEAETQVARVDSGLAEISIVKDDILVISGNVEALSDQVQSRLVDIDESIQQIGQIQDDYENLVIDWTQKKQEIDDTLVIMYQVNEEMALATADTIEATNRAESLVIDAKEYTDAHAERTDIHITPEERENWNNMVAGEHQHPISDVTGLTEELIAIDEHITNAQVHVTPEEKEIWNESAFEISPDAPNTKLWLKVII